MYNILDLTIWQAAQLEVNKMNSDARQREDELVDMCVKAWELIPDVNILRAFEMRRDCANEALEIDGCCETEGKGRGGAKRVHEDAAYPPLRLRLGI